MQDSNFTLILLTYKGKILLTTRESTLDVVESFLWHFIGGEKQKNKSERESITKLVEKETGIKLDSIDFLSKHELPETTEYFYCAQLTDDHVNNLERGKGRLVNFYSVLELDSLPLTDRSKSFISSHREIIEKVS